MEKQPMTTEQKEKVINFLKGELKKCFPTCQFIDELESDDFLGEEFGNKDSYFDQMVFMAHLSAIFSMSFHVSHCDSLEDITENYGIFILSNLK